MTDSRNILERLERLERENRRLKRGASSVLILGFAVLLMGQGRPNRMIEAEKFVLRDPAGRMRGEIATLSSGPVFRLFDTNGEVRALLSGAVMSFYEEHKNYAQLTGTGLFLKNNKGQIVLSRGGVADPAKPSTSAMIGLYGANSKLEISDDEDFSTVLGSSSLLTPRTGQSSKTSAASIVLSGKGKVLWSAP